jgi:hypothetical protein
MRNEAALPVPFRKTARVVRKKKPTRSLSGAARIGGLIVIAPSGSGKSIFQAKYVALPDARHGLPQVVLDVGGHTIQYFLHALLFLSPAEQRSILDRVIYCDMAGQNGYVSSWPMLAPQRETESLAKIASRVPELLGQLEAPPIGE